jgi:hypothetical protein
MAGDGGRENLIDNGASPPVGRAHDVRPDLVADDLQEFFTSLG